MMKTIYINVKPGQEVVIRCLENKTDVPPQDNIPSLKEICELISKVVFVTPEQIVKRGRKESIVFIRNIFVQVATIYGYSTKQIGIFLDHRDHTTICNCLTVFADMYETNDYKLMKYLEVIQHHVPNIIIKPFRNNNWL